MMRRKRIVVLITMVMMIIILLACSLPENGGSEADVSIALTQTFAAAATELEGTRAAMQGEDVEPPPSEGEEPNPGDEEVSPSETPQPSATIVHITRPGEFPGGRESGVSDPDSSSTAGQNRASRGENFSANLFERPFTSEGMVYYPDLDIVKTTLNRSGDWIYVEITVQGTRDGRLQGTYGAEFDLNVDGRGDCLVLASDLSTEWTTDGVRAWKDTNYDVGDGIALISDPPQGGNGYDDLVFDQGIGIDPDLAWARIDPSDPNSAQIAVKKSFLNNDGEFVWGGWTDQAVRNPAWYDYNDHFTHDEAGSPLSGLAQYPLKSLSEVDNTCRWSVGFTLVGDEPGICPLPYTPTPTATLTPTIVPGRINGIVFDDANGDLAYQAGELGLSGAGVRIQSGDCGSPGADVATVSTGSDGRYSVGGLAPGTYCVSVPTDPIRWNDKTGPTTVTIGPGGSGTANFGYFWLG